MCPGKSRGSPLTKWANFQMLTYESLGYRNIFLRYFSVIPSATHRTVSPNPRQMSEAVAGEDLKHIVGMIS